jgi:Na+-transporting methylmalonyl-CoA/oxaloacetate decarboxylase gamma subunit
MEGEQEMWFFVSIVLACLLILITILYFLKKGKTEKEIVYKEKKVVVHQPAEDQSEMIQKVADLERMYKTSLQSIQKQDAEKIEQQKINQEAIQFLKEAQAELKKIQENKTMTAEDFMRLSNAVQRAITKL